MTREDVDALGPVGVHLARARLVGSRFDADEALSHVTAAVVHGLDVWDAPLGRIHVTRPPTRSCRVSDDLHIHTSDLEAEVTRLESLGAQRVAQHHLWQVMRDPAGLVFCVIPDRQGRLDDTNATRWDTP